MVPETTELESLKRKVAKLEAKVSESLEMEEALKGSEEKFRNFFNHSNDAIFIHDLEGRIIEANQKAESLFGYTDSEIKNLEISALHPESAVEKSSQALKQLVNERFIRFEIDFKTKTGHVFPAEVSSSIFMSGGRQYIQKIVRDISNRKRVEKALRDSENRYKSLFNNNHAVMLIIDPEDGEILDVNPAAVSYYGWSHEEITRKKISDINMLSKQEILREMEKAKKELRRIFHFQHRLAGGDIRDVEVYSGPIPIGGRNLLFSIIHDTTDRKKAEEERSNLIRKLQTALKEIKTLRGILPICASCKKIRDDQGYWNQLETYIYEHSEAQFSHGLCPDCTRELYPETYARIQAKKKKTPDE